MRTSTSEPHPIGTLAERLKELAADAMEAGVADLEVADGGVRIAGTDRAITFAEIARLPAAKPDKLTASDSWKPPEATYPNGTHVCEVEVDLTHRSLDGVAPEHLRAALVAGCGADVVAPS